MQKLDAHRLLGAEVPGLGRVTFVQNGAGVTAFGPDGDLVWSTPGLGMGELVDVADLDGDGSLELIYSPFARGGAGGTASAPGELLVMDASSGAVLWRYAFEGLESGISRERTAIGSFDGGATQSIVTVLTYSSHVWRFDFSSGVRSGRVVWKSNELIYNAPYKRPLIKDVDGDGSPEVIADTYGRLYVLDGMTGAVDSATSYIANYTFSGFLQSVETANARGFIVVSNSVYADVAAFIEYRDGQLSARWTTVFEQGIENQNVIFTPARGTVQLGGRHYLIWSVGSRGNESLQMIDLESGQRRFELANTRMRQLLRGEDGITYVLAESSNTMLVLSPGPTGFGLVAQYDGVSWFDTRETGRPSKALAPGQAPTVAALLDANREVRLLSVDAFGDARLRAMGPGVVPQSGGSIHLSLEGDEVLASDGEGLRRLAPSGLAKPAGSHGAISFAVPLIADLDADGQRELIVPYGPTLGIGRANPGDEVGLQPFGGPRLAIPREGLLSPVVSGRPGTPRNVVGFEALDRITLVSRAVDGSQQWSTFQPIAGWEASLASGIGETGDSVLYYHDSLGTARLDPADGQMLWYSGRVGQCQRQMVVTDLNADGIPDVAVQSGDHLGVYSAAGGGLLDSAIALASYGGYLALAHANEGSGADVPRIFAHNSGGLTVRAPLLGQTLTDAQIDTRLFESLPLVVQHVDATGNNDRVWQVSGEGLIRQLAIDGSTLTQRDINEPVLGVSGAFVDTDQVLDLLITTFRGELIAVSGDPLREMWRLDLGVAANTAVVADLDGDGAGEILAIAVDGRLLTVKQREAGGFGLTAAGELVSIDAATGSTLPVAPLSGLAANETPVGLDFRPLDEQLYVLGRDDVGVGRIYRVATDSAVAQPVATMHADPADASAPFVSLPTGALAIDIDPVADRLVIATESDLVLVVDLTDGATTTESIDAPAGAALRGIAFSNNRPDAVDAPLYALDIATDRVLGVSTEAGGGSSVVGALGVDAVEGRGFDIAAVGMGNNAFAALLTGAELALHRLDLATGMATRLGVLPSNVVDIAVRGQEASSNSLLAALATDTGELSPAFSPTINNYVVLLSAETSSVSLAAAAANSGASVEIQGEPSNPGEWSSPVAVGEGSTVVVVLVTAEDSQTTRRYQVSLVRPPSLSVGPAQLAPGAYGTAYSAPLQVIGAGGVPPYRFELAGGALPAGMTLSPAGVLSGEAESPGNYSFVVRARDSTPVDRGGPFIAAGEISIQVTRAQQAIEFGQLPDVVFDTAPINLESLVQASSLLPVTLASNTPETCQVSGFLLTMLATGRCELQASQAGDGNFFEAAAVRREFSIGKRPTQLRLFAGANPAAAGGTLALSAELSGAPEDALLDFLLDNTPISACTARPVIAHGNSVAATCEVSLPEAADYPFEVRYAGDSRHHPAADRMMVTAVLGADVRLGLQRVSPAASLSLASAQTTLAEYRLSAENLGPRNLASVRIDTERLIGLHGVLWSCLGIAGSCSPSAGSGAPSLSFPLDAGTSKEVSIIGLVDSGERFIELRVTATGPAEVPSMNPSDDEVAIVDPIAAEAIFRGSFD